MSPHAIPKTLRSLRDERYRLVSSLGEGGMATVWLARDTELDVDRAIKLIHPDPSKRRALRRRLKAEARAMARLSHPNILRILDVGAEGDYDYVVMDLAPGGSLQDKLDANGALHAGLAVAYSVQVLSALAAAHAAGIVHRDVKPQNILLDATGRALLADFGIALLADDDLDRKTKAGVAMGSLAYMPPEQRVDARSVGPAADIYAAGATLYALLTQSNPVDLFSAGESSPRWDGIHPVLAAIIRTSTSVQVADRFQSAGEMARELMMAAKLISPSELPEPGRPGDLFPTPSNVFATQGNTSGSTVDSSPSTPAPPNTRQAHPTLAPADASASSAGPTAPSTSDPGYTPTVHTDVDVRAATAMALKLIDDVPATHVSGPTLVEAELGALDDDDDGLGLVMVPSSTPPAEGAAAAPLSLDARPSTHPPARKELQLRATIAVGILLLAAVVALLALFLRDPTGAPVTNPLAEGGVESIVRDPRPIPGMRPEDAEKTQAAASPNTSGSDAAKGTPPSDEATGESSGPLPPGSTSSSETPSRAGDGVGGTDGASTSTPTATPAVVAPPAPPEASHLPPPFGSWKGSAGGRVMTVKLTGTHEAVKGEFKVSFGPKLSISGVRGSYSPSKRKLTLTDSHDGPDAGTYELTLSSDEQRLEGTFTRHVGGIVSLALKRTP